MSFNPPMRDKTDPRFLAARALFEARKECRKLEMDPDDLGNLSRWYDYHARLHDYHARLQRNIRWLDQEIGL